MHVTISIDDTPRASGRGSPWTNPYQDLSDDASTDSSNTPKDLSSLLLQSLGQMMSAMAPLLSAVSQLMQQAQQMACGGQQGANDLAQKLARMLGGDDTSPSGGCGARHESPLDGCGARHRPHHRGASHAPRSDDCCAPHAPSPGACDVSPSGGCDTPPSGCDDASPFGGSGDASPLGGCGAQAGARPPHGGCHEMPRSHLPGNGGVGVGSVGTGGFSTEPATGRLSMADSQKTGVAVADKLMQDFPGLTKAGAAGIVGNLYHESWGMNSNINEGGATGAPNSSQLGYGWAQWSGSRKNDYVNFCQQNGMDPSSPAANYAMLKHELETDENGTIAALKGAHTPEDAAMTFRKVFERADDKSIASDSDRVANANMIYGLMG